MHLRDDRETNNRLKMENQNKTTTLSAFSNNKFNNICILCFKAEQVRINNAVYLIYSVVEPEKHFRS